jgi:3-methyladenine DNA glycosylase/8-oxoguanine DNA glycosylase
MVTGGLERRWRPTWPADLATTLGPLAHGRHDPAAQLRPEGIWRATRTPAGPATILYSRAGADVVARAWGPGAELELTGLPQLLGAGDDPTGFPADAHPAMAAAHRRFGAGWRVPSTGRTLEALIPAILEQRVTGLESSRAWRWLVLRHGEPAPGPGPDLVVPPDGPGWARIPSWSWHRAGVDPGRARTIVAAAARADRIEELATQPPEQASATLRSLPGIGAWTAAEVAVRAWGDIDAVSFGDYHLAAFVVHALTGRRGGTDEQMAELLAPWAGQRARAVRLLELHGPAPPRRGPRAPVTDHRRR